MNLTQLIVMMFGIFDKANDTTRQQLYAKILKDIPLDILEKAILKVIYEWKFSYVPPIAVVLEASRSINDEINPKYRTKSWDEAWKEIEKAMWNTPWGHTPKWSTPEIAEAVNAYGWYQLQTALSSDMPTIHAQIRRLYDDACNRATSKAQNENIMGKNPAGIIGVPLGKIEVVKQLQAVANAVALPQH